MKTKYIIIINISYLFLLVFFLNKNYYFLLIFLFLNLFFKQIRHFYLILFQNIRVFILFYISKNKNCLFNGGKKDKKIIVSLTTYSKRINTVFLTIETLFRQKTKADRIILWLDKDEFTLENLPNTLKKQIKKGLEIDFYHNIKSYKKFIPSLQRYGDDIIITADDDLFYSKKFIKRLYDKYLVNPNKVYYYYGFFYTDKNYHTLNFKKYEKLYKCYKFNYIGTGGGVLIPPNIFRNTDILKEEIFMKLAPTTDDVFFSVMCIINNIQVEKIHNKKNYLSTFGFIFDTQDIGLSKYNNFSVGNGQQLKNLVKYYQLKLNLA